MGILKSLKQLFFGSSVDFQELIEKGAIVVDVRTKNEFKEGHAKGSINIPLQTFSSQIQTMKGKEIVLVCRSGMRAKSAKNILKKHGIVSYNAGAWQNIT